MSENLILKPEEVVRRNQPPIVIENVEEKEKPLVNTAGLVKIQFESQNRFATPEILYFDDFTGKHINDIELSNQDNLLENLLVILNELQKGEENFDLKNAATEDLLEILVGIKQKFEGDSHIHYWICDCQSDKTEKDRIINEHFIKLSELQYKSMTDVDNDMKQYLSKVFSEMSDEQFKQFLYIKYKNNPIENIDLHTREIEVESTIIKEPFNIISGDDIYTLRYPRIGDILKAKKYVEKIYNPKIKNVQNRKEANVPLHELKSKKEDEINALKEEQGKLMVLYTKALMLISKNGLTLSDNDKYEEFKNNMKRNTINKIEQLFEFIDFGLSTEIELQCPICGNSEKRLLREVLDPRQLLPLKYKQSDSGNTPQGNIGNNTGLTFYFGI